MDAVLAMFLDGGTEWTHTASAILVLVIGGVGTVFWFYYRRDVSRSDAAAKEQKQLLDQHDDQLNNHETRITVVEDWRKTRREG